MKGSQTAALVLGLAIAATGQAVPTITSLGTLPGHSQAFGAAVSSDGTTVVGFCRSVAPASDRGFRWTQAGGIQDLGMPHAFAVNRDGTVVVGGNERWSVANGVESLGVDLAPTAVNGDGTVIAGIDTQYPAGGRAFRLANGITQDLGALDGEESWASGISADGSIVVGGANGSVTSAFRWTGSGGMESLGWLPGGETYAVANAISGDGQVIVGTSATAQGPHAFRWTLNDGMQDLGTLPGQWESTATAVSHDGRLIVGKSGTRLFAWSESSGLLDLESFLSTYGVNLAGWSLTHVAGVSADGSVLCGTGLLNGEIRGWVVTGVPAPASGCVLAIACIVVGRRRLA